MQIAALNAYCNELLARWRAEQRRPQDLLRGSKGVVVVGAGNAGQAFVAALLASDIPVLAVSDNDAGKWGSALLGLPVLSPADAAARFGQETVFIVAIGRLSGRIERLLDQFTRLGAKTVLPFTQAVAFLPAIWPHFFLDPEAFSVNDIPSIADAFMLMNDETSREVFRSHLGWRMTLDPAFLSTPTYDDQYFSQGIVTVRDCAVFLDVGAYTGDTLAELNRFSDGSFAEYYGFEPDPKTYLKLRSRASEIAGAIKARIHTENIAIGASSTPVAFSSDGTPSSRSGTGEVMVACRTLDSFGFAKPTFLKVDVEGYEDEVLRGAVHTLKRTRPLVAIATYHHPRDMFEIPLKLAAICPDYLFHLRYHGDAGTELDCYAVPRKGES